MDFQYTLNFRTRAVAGAVTPKQGKPRTHAVGIATGQVLCKTVSADHVLIDDHATSPLALPTCPKCLTAYAKLCAFHGLLETK